MMGIPDRGLHPVQHYGERRPHGDRLRYMAGCRCDSCRRANTRYESERQRARRSGDWNGIVDASRARRHLRKLRNAGVGRRAVSAASDVSQSVLAEIVAGTRLRIRARTERLVLAVTPTLNAHQAAKGREMHLCPMQFDLADRVITQYSMPGETVLDPFAGLMTVPERAVRLKRYGIGIELSTQYFLDGVAYCHAAAREMSMPDLFEQLEDCA